jgi:hypothetical protein
MTRCQARSSTRQSKSGLCKTRTTFGRLFQLIDQKNDQRLDKHGRVSFELKQYAPLARQVAPKAE